jgi:hypothetical protein
MLSGQFLLTYQGCNNFIFGLEVLNGLVLSTTQAHTVFVDDIGQYLIIVYLRPNPVYL